MIREQYGDDGPTLASEVLAQEHALVVNRETLLQWMSAEKLWKPRRQKLNKVQVWRPRRRHRGELVPWDASEHDWLEGRGPKLYLIAMIDDATSELTGRFALSDSTAENMQLLKRYVELHGRPAAVYTDKAGLFQVNRPLHHNKHLDAEPASSADPGGRSPNSTSSCCTAHRLAEGEALRQSDGGWGRFTPTLLKLV